MAVGTPVVRPEEPVLLSERLPKLSNLLREIPGLDREMVKLSDANAAQMAADYIRRMQVLQALLDRDNGVDDVTRLNAEVQYYLLDIAKNVCLAVQAVGCEGLPVVEFPTQVKDSLKEIERRKNTHLYQLDEWAKSLYTESARARTARTIDKSAVDATLGRTE
jgi:hypothetical protein